MRSEVYVELNVGLWTQTEDVHGSGGANVGLWTQIEDVHGSGGANVGLWTQTEDVHGLGGAPHQFNTLNECKEACINDIGCVAIDWEPSNVGYECWTLSTSATSPTTAAGFITHYALNRDAVGETIFPLYTPRLGCF